MMGVFRIFLWKHFVEFFTLDRHPFASTRRSNFPKKKKF